MPLYKRVPLLVTLYRRIALRWPAAPRTIRVYLELRACVRRMGDR